MLTYSFNNTDCAPSMLWAPLLSAGDMQKTAQSSHYFDAYFLVETEDKSKQAYDVKVKKNYSKYEHNTLSATALSNKLSVIRGLPW